MILFKGVTHLVGSRPLIDLREESVGCDPGFLFSLLDICRCVQEMFVEGPPNVVFRIDTDGTEVLVGVGDDNIFVAPDFLEDSGLEFGEVRFAALRFEVGKNGLLKFIESARNGEWGLLWHPLTRNSELLEGFVVL